jgi:hypothetical protein
LLEVYDLEAIALSEDWGVQAIEAITPTPIQKLPDDRPVLYPALPVADQNLFTSAILAVCDKLDGTVDGVVDNLPACWAKFDPAIFVFLVVAGEWELPSAALNSTSARDR